MRPQTIGIAATTLVAGITLFTSVVNAQDLQWVQTTRQQPTTQTVARVSTANGTAVQPTFRQPTAFKQPTSARSIAEAQVATTQPVLKVAEAQARRTAERTYVGVLPAQYTEAEEIPPMEADEYYGEPMVAGPMMMQAPMMMGEVGCGVPEPTCGCAAPYGCGDACYSCEPGCCAGDVMFGEASCAAPCGCGSCGDACGCGNMCGDMCGQPGCGCSCGNSWYDDGCETINWPEALFGFEARGCTPILWIPPLKEWTMYGGVQGFKGPLDAGRDGGGFGFHEGFNLGGKMAWLPWPGLGYQFGYRATQNQLHGDAVTGSDDSHSQHFITTGLFHRNRFGWRYGVVWDMLRDERQGSNDYGQVRGQLGWMNPHGREFGFQFASHSNDNVLGTTTYQSADQYLFYYQIYGRQGGDCRAFAGFSGDSNGIIGTDFHMPLNCNWSLAGNWTYMMAEGGSNGSGAQDEAWNLGMSLVWHYGSRAKQWSSRPFRPMFDVADNGSLIVTE